MYFILQKYIIIPVFTRIYRDFFDVPIFFIIFAE